MKSLPPKQKIELVGLIALAALSAAAYFVGVEPILTREAQAASAEAELAAKRRTASDAELALGQVRRQLMQVEQAASADPLRLVPLHRLNGRLADIAAVASRHGLQIDQLEPGRPTPAEHYVTVPIRVTGRSGYGAAARFLHDLRESMPDIAVATIELVGEPQSESAAAKATLSLVWHAAPERRQGE